MNGKRNIDRIFNNFQPQSQISAPKVIEKDESKPQSQNGPDMEQRKKPHVNIGSVGHASYDRSSLNSAIETLLKTPEMRNQNSERIAPKQEHKPQTLSEQLMREYEIKKRMEEMRWLEEIGYFDDLERRAKQALMTENGNNEENLEK